MQQNISSHIMQRNKNNQYATQDSDAPVWIEAHSPLTVDRSYLSQLFNQFLLVAAIPRI
jgi:hypothetical protein